MIIKFRSGNDGLGDAVSRETSIVFDPAEDMTQQEFRDEVDINTIVRRFGVTGKVPVSAVPGQVGDFTGVTDYQTALNSLLEADAAFEVLPASVRERFRNSAAMMLQFLEDPANRDEAVKLGLVAAPVVPPVASEVKA